MRAIPTAIPDVIALSPNVFGDNRGFFYESYNQKVFQDATGLDVTFVQDNHSKYDRNVLRGLHYHHHQIDYWYVPNGQIRVGMVDLRPSSGTTRIWRLTGS